MNVFLLSFVNLSVFKNALSLAELNVSGNVYVLSNAVITGNTDARPRNSTKQKYDATPSTQYGDRTRDSQLRKLTLYPLS